MTLDVQNAHNVAGGEPYVPPPVEIEGLFVEPSVLTRASQLTGDGTTVLVLRHTGGRAKLFESARDFGPNEITVVNKSGAQYDQTVDGVTTEFSSGQAVWFALVAVKHGPAGNVNLLAVPGALAAVADAVVPTYDEIVAALGLGERASVGICGDIRFHRSADTVVTVAVSNKRRPSYVDDSKKVSAVLSQDDQAAMGVRFWGFVQGSVDLASASAKTAGQLVIDGLTLPHLPYGGYLGAPEYIGAAAGAGAGADLTFLLNLDGVACTGGALQLLLATTAIPAKVTGTTPSAGHKFLPGATLDLELDVKTTVFSAGSGTVRVPIYEYTPR